MFRSKRAEVTAGWRKLHNEELHNFAKYNLIAQDKEGEQYRNMFLANLYIPDVCQLHGNMLCDYYNKLFYLLHNTFDLIVFYTLIKLMCVV
jgi:hypothetical protein